MRMCEDCVFPHVRQCAQARCAPSGRLVKILDPLRLIPGLGTRMSNPLVPPCLPPRLASALAGPALARPPRFHLGSQIAGKFQRSSPGGSARDQGIFSGEPPKPPSRHRVLGTRRVKGRPTSWSGKAPEHTPVSHGTRPGSDQANRQPNRLGAYTRISGSYLRARTSQTKRRRDSISDGRAAAGWLTG